MISKPIGIPPNRATHAQSESNLKISSNSEFKLRKMLGAAHAFNVLDARGVISVTERQGYILRIREMSKACGGAWLQTAAGGAE